MPSGSGVPVVANPRHQRGLTAAGILDETWNPGTGSSTSSPATQVVYGSLLGLLLGDLVTGIVLSNNVAAVAANPTTARAGIADSTGKILAISGNLNAAANWPVGRVLLPFAAQYTVLADGGYYACLVVNGVWATQPLLWRSFSGAPAGGNAIGTNAPQLFSWAGQTDLPAVNSSLTLTTNSVLNFYMGFY